MSNKQNAQAFLSFHSILLALNIFYLTF